MRHLHHAIHLLIACSLFAALTWSSAVALQGHALPTAPSASPETANGGDGGEAAPRATPVATSRWTVTDIQEIPGASGPLVLSPDGSRVFAQDPYDFSRVCIVFVDFGEERCDSTGFDNAHAIDPLSITWAPDTSAVAFGLNVSMLGINPDILVIDAATGIIANLTDDGDAALTDGLPYDVFASWSRDGMSLAFQRLTIGEPGSLALMSVPRTGGEPATLAAMPEDQELRLNAPLRQLPDDSWLFSSGPGTPGISRLAPDGSIHTLVDGDTEGDYPNPILADLAADGRHAAFVTLPVPGAADPGIQLAFLDLSTNAVVPVAFDTPPTILPTFSPDGRDLLVVSDQGGEPASVWLVPAGSGAPVELARIDPPAEPIPGLAAMPLQPGVGWSRANTILVHTYTNTVILTVSRTA